MADISTKRPLSVGVSACLLGQSVRYDGADKRQDWLEELRKHCDVLAICPEVEAGLPVPRPPVRLVWGEGGVRALGVHEANVDVTEQLLSFAHARLPDLAHLDAFVFKSRSPSCGVGSAPLFDRHGSQQATVSGLFAQAVAKRYPNLELLQEDRVWQWLHHHVG